MNTLAPSQFIRFGWEAFKKRPWFLAGITIVIMVISGIASNLGGNMEHAQGAALVVSLVALFVGIVAQIFIKMGSINFALKANDDVVAVRVSDLWAPEMFWQYLLASIVVGIMVVVGFILLIVPGIYLALRFLFVQYLIVDRKMGMSDALKESSRMTEGKKWRLLGFLLLVILLNIVGAILLFVGLLVTIPVTMIATAHLYRSLEHSANEVVAA
ncbi:MAG TPA: glycerophosphoryl diester phosphodiesterase membrane domain-containing protein [Candidatus Paceibacterota bacterium]|nr:glycerophosphoryl diester phosphodiesterase membrane domain-containing protein [Candidatus Paceibacterota bacterium]